MSSPLFIREKAQLKTKPASITVACTNVHLIMLQTYYGKIRVNQKIQEKEKTETFSLLLFPH